MTTILFAAGASRQFFATGLTTEYLTAKVKDIEQWTRVIDKYRRIMGGNICIAKPSDVVYIINRVCYYKPEANFEEIAEIIDKLSSYSTDFRPGYELMNLVQMVLLDCLRISGNRLLGIGLQDVPFLYRQIIAEAILDLEFNKKSNDYDDLIAKQRSFINYATQNSEKASLISLNYDDCVLDSIKGGPFTMGTELVSNKHGFQVDTHTFMNAHKVVYFPHGQLRFQMKDNENVTVWDNAIEANENRWKGISSCSIGSTLRLMPAKYAYSFNTFLVTGQTKDDTFNYLPYSLYYQRMAIDFAQSSDIIIIGYSFGDEHFNRLLSSFLKMNVSNHLYVVDYYSDDVTMTEEFKDMNNIITKIYRTFHTDWFFGRTENGEIASYNPYQIHKINKYGYGEIFSQVTFYKKGYTEFLKEYDSVLL